MDNPNHRYEIPDFAKKRTRNEEGFLEGERSPAQVAAQDFSWELRKLQAMHREGALQERYEEILKREARGEMPYRSKAQLEGLIGAMERVERGEDMEPHQLGFVHDFVLAESRGSQLPGFPRRTPALPEIQRMELQRERAQLEEPAGAVILENWRSGGSPEWRKHRLREIDQEMRDLEAR